MMGLSPRGKLPEDQLRPSSPNNTYFTTPRDPSHTSPGLAGFPPLPPQGSPVLPPQAALLPWETWLDLHRGGRRGEGAPQPQNLQQAGASQSNRGADRQGGPGPKDGKDTPDTQPSELESESLVPAMGGARHLVPSLGAGACSQGQDGRQQDPPTPSSPILQLPENGGAPGKTVGGGEAVSSAWPFPTTRDEAPAGAPTWHLPRP